MTVTSGMAEAIRQRSLSAHSSEKPSGLRKSTYVLGRIVARASASGELGQAGARAGALRMRQQNERGLPGCPDQRCGRGPVTGSRCAFARGVVRTSTATRVPQRRRSARRPSRSTARSVTSMRIRRCGRELAICRWQSKLVANLTGSQKRP